jgi:hypothetical protein
MLTYGFDRVFKHFIEHIQGEVDGSHGVLYAEQWPCSCKRSVV